MNFESAKRLQKLMPYKKIFWDIVYKCYRLINRSELYEYKDEEGQYHIRHNVQNLVAVSS